MRKFQKLFYSLLMMFFVGFIVGCDITEITLDTPTNVQIQNGVLTWTAVDQAESYRIVVGTNTHVSNTTTFDLKALGLAEGSYQVTVVAIQGDKASLPSSLVNYVISPTDITTLSAPLNVAISNGVVTWSAVTNALGYVVFVGTLEFPVSTTTIDLKQQFLPEGTHQVTVKAVRNAIVSPVSSAVSHTVVLLADSEAIYEAVLVLMNPAYEPDMTEDDFDDEWEYDDYQRFSKLLKRFSEAVVEIGMEEDDAIAMFSHMMEMPDRMEDITGPSGMIAEIDSYEQFGFTAQSFTHLMMEMADIVLDIIDVETEKEVLRRETQILEHEAEVQRIRATADYIALKSKFASYANAQNLDLFNSFLSGNQDGSVYYALGTVYTIAYDLLYNYQWHDAWYLDEGDPYIQMFYDMMLQAKTNNTTADIEFLSALYQNSYGTLSPFYDLFYELGNLEWEQDSLDEALRSVEMAEAMRQLMNEERAMMQQSMLLVVEFVTDLYGSIPASMITRLDQLVDEGELSLEEYLLLKNEIVGMLQTNLPTAADFSTLYTMMFTVGEAMGGVDIGDFSQHAIFLGQLDYLLFDLLLTMLADIDQTMIEDVMEIVDGMIIPGEYYYDEEYQYGYKEDNQVDFRKVIQLAVYLGTYFENFKSENQLKFTLLEALPIEDKMEEFFTIFATIMKEQLEGEMDEDEYEMVAWFIDSIVDDFPAILDGLKVFEGIGTEMIDEFLTSEGKFFLDFLDFAEMMEGDQDPQIVVAALEALFGEFVAYNSAIMNELDLASIQKVLRLVRVPLTIAMMENGDMDPESFQELFDDLVLPVATILSNVVTIQKQLVLIVDQTDIEGSIFGTWNLEIDESMMALIVIVLDEALTPAIEDLIFASLTIVFDDILAHPTILDMTEMTQTELDDMYDEIYSMIEDVVAEIRIVADFDFDNPTVGQVDQLLGLFEMFG